MPDQGRTSNAEALAGRLLRAGEVRLSIEAPDGRDALACRSAYFTELGERFEAGFDVESGKAANDAAMRPPRGAFLVARLDGEAVGCGGFAPLEGGVAEVKRMWTASHARGLGIGRRLLEELERRAKDAGFRAIRLDTNRALTEAHAFYRAQGYREIARYNDNPYAHLWFEKVLAPG